MENTTNGLNEYAGSKNDAFPDIFSKVILGLVASMFVVSLIFFLRKRNIKCGNEPIQRSLTRQEQHARIHVMCS